MPWLSIRDAKAHHGGTITNTVETTNELGIANSSARLLPAKTVCLSRTASVGYVVVTTRPMATSQDFVNWVCGDELEPAFLQFLFLAEGDDLLRFSSGAVHQTIYFPEAKAFYVCIPPLTEQRRIVAILDDAFEGIATATANAEKNLKNALELFEVRRDSIFAAGRRSWPRRTLGDISEVQSGGTPLISTNAYWGGEVAWYSSGELNHLTTSDPERHITQAGLKGSNAKLFPKDSLLIGMYDTAALKMSVLDREAAFNQAIAGVKPNGVLDTRFLLHSINAVKAEILSQRRGVRQKNLSLSKIKEITVPLPTIKVQHEVINELRDLQMRSGRLRDNYQRKVSALSDLKKSLLQCAFKGLL